MAIDLAKISESLQSDESKQLFSEILRKEKAIDITHQSQLERFHNKYSDKLNEVIELLESKYSSDEYVTREYKLGYQPREPLMFFLFSYAQKYLKECNDELYLNTFTTRAYYIGDYVIQRMDGQGSVIMVTKIHKTYQEHIQDYLEIFYKKDPELYIRHKRISPLTEEQYKNELITYLQLWFRDLCSRELTRKKAIESILITVFRYTHNPNKNTKPKEYKITKNLLNKNIKK